MKTCSGCRGGQCACPQACTLAEDAAWMNFHRRMCLVTVGLIVVGAMLAVWVIV